MRNKNIFFSLVLIPILNCGSQGSAVAGDPATGRLALTDAMLKMMDAMGMIGQSGRADSGHDFSRRWESMAPDAKSMHSQNGRTPPTSAPGYAPSHWRKDGSRELMTLQGDWSSESGERLQIRGPRFRLRAGAAREVDGTLSLRGHLLSMYSPRYDQTWIYEYAEHGGRLVLRDNHGRLYLYRRVHDFPRERRPAATPWVGKSYAPSTLPN